jgi:hypothetical protein
MITGNTEPLLTVESYEGESGALGVVQRFLEIFHRTDVK